CLEAVMRWRHGSMYGCGVTNPPAWNAANQRYEAQYGAQRAAHSPAAQAHTGIGFNPGNYLNDYGLVQLQKPANAVGWEAYLRTYGPLIVTGHIGAVRIIPIDEAGHYIVVVGVTANNDIEYYDPLRLWHALGADPTTQDEAKFDELAYHEVYAAAV